MTFEASQIKEIIEQTVRELTKQNTSRERELTMTSIQTKNIEEMQTEIKEINKKLENFLTITYEVDMRGDKNAANGNRGVIGALRSLREEQSEMKKDLEKYPSLTKMIATEPVKTLSSISIIGVSVWLVLATLYQFGLLKLLAGIFGIDIP